MEREVNDKILLHSSQISQPTDTNNRTFLFQEPREVAPEVVNGWRTPLREWGRVGGGTAPAFRANCQGALCRPRLSRASCALARGCCRPHSSLRVLREAGSTARKIRAGGAAGTFNKASEHLVPPTFFYTSNLAAVKRDVRKIFQFLGHWAFQRITAIQESNAGFNINWENTGVIHPLWLTLRSRNLILHLHHKKKKNMYFISKYIWKQPLWSQAT